MGVRTGAVALGVAAALAALAALAGCGHQSSTGTGVVNAPDKVVPLAGTTLNRVILSPPSAARLGIVTRPAKPAGNGATVVPVSAVIYDQNGKTWVYTSPDPFTYVRDAVTLGPVDNGEWVLKSGPAAGTAVVTVGGAELLGAEQGVEGE